MVCCVKNTDVGANFAIVFCFEVGFLIICMSRGVSLYQVIWCKKKSKYQNGISGNWIRCCSLLQFCNFEMLIGSLVQMVQNALFKKR